MATSPRTITRLRKVCDIAVELCAAVDCADEDVGGCRSMREIMGDLGPAVDEALASVASDTTAPAIVAEVGDIGELLFILEDWSHKGLRDLSDEAFRVRCDRIHTALRTLAEVREKVGEFINCAFVGDGPTYSCLLCGQLGTDHPKYLASVCESRLRDINQLNDQQQAFRQQLAAATQRAEQAEAECRLVKQEHNDYIANTVQKLHAKVFSLEQDRDHWKEQAQPVVSLKEGLVSELIERCMRAEAGRDAAIETLKLAREFIRKPDLTTSRDFAQEELWDKLQAALALPAPATNATGSSHEKD